LTQPAPTWEGLTGADLARRWDVPAVSVHSSVGSTNDVVRLMAADGAPDGLVVLADQQTAGRGRAGRNWHSPAGLGLWVSMLARPRPGASAPALPLAVGIAVASALDPFVAGTFVQIKWPNDLFVDGRKLGGILCEGVWEGGTLRHLVAGLGINLLHNEEDFPPDILAGATSLAVAAGRQAISRLRVADAVIAGLVHALADGHAVADPVAAESAATELSHRDMLRDRRVTVTEPTTGAAVASGIAAGIAPDGSLLLRTPDGDIQPILSGTVRIEE
jgi:BirA family biotin operon repressor/biotin-[acetyl-CoA-carboxylase] ligase